MELPGLVAWILILAVACVAAESEGTPKPNVDLVEARYDRYYDIFRYWWPWFSDLTLVIFIKLKIAILLVAMHVFGDGYYWNKLKGTNVYDHSQWSSSWGRRRRSVIPTELDRGSDMAEFIFDTLDISDDTCRRRVVCELYLEGKHVPEIWRALTDPGYEVFRAYRPKDSVVSSSDCRKIHPCQFGQTKDDLVQLQPTVHGDDDWRWPR